MTQMKDLKKIILELGLLEADEESCAETLGDADGERQGPVNGPKEGLEHASAQPRLAQR
jgi:hypothetical protein